MKIPDCSAARCHLLCLLLPAVAQTDSAAPAASGDAVDAAEQLSALFDEQFERNLEMNPLSATAIGDDRYDDRMANIEQPGISRCRPKPWMSEFLARLLEIDRDALSLPGAMSYDIFRIRA